MNFRFAWTFTLVLVITGGFLAGMAYMGNSHRNLPQPQPETGGTPKSPSTQVSKQTQYGQAVEQSTTVPPASLIKSDAPKVHQDQGNTNTSAQKEATYAGFLVIIGVFAVVVAGLQYCATKSAADAARASAKAALLALEAEKPYVFAEEPRIETLTARVPALTFSFPPQFAMVAQQWLMFRLNNRGKGVAIIESIWIRAVLSVAMMVDSPAIQPERKNSRLGSVSLAR